MNKLSDKQKELLTRLKVCAEAELEAAKRALSEDASEGEIKIALYLCKISGIE